jgi:hypothetical protein
MKMLLFLLLFAAPMFCLAQTDTTANKQKVAYCIAEITSDGSKYDMMFDDGSTQNRDGIKVKDAKGKIIAFDSKISALNYVNQLGWKLVSSYTVSVGLYDVAFVFERPVAK